MNNNYDDVVVDIKAMLDASSGMTSDDDECCIYRVPFDIRKLNEDAYTPKIISIGPFHHTLPRLQNMQNLKLTYCNALFQRTDDDTTIDRLVVYLGDVVDSRFRRCYSDTIELSNEELVKLVFIDACFIIELFLRFFKKKNNDNNDGDNDTSSSLLLSKPPLATSIRMDLILLENQLPFFVLQNVYNNICFIRSSSSRSNNINTPSFMELTFEYFSFYNRSPPPNSNSISIRHFTDLIRTFYLHGRDVGLPSRECEPAAGIHLPCVTELVGAGVNIKVNTESECLLDFRFSSSGGVLEIPQLKVEDWTESLFRNMVALEQCHYPEKSYITDYVAILSFLINTKGDVDILVNQTVLINWLGDTDSSVATLFNGVWKNITQLDFNQDYYRLCQQLNKYYEYTPHKMKAILARDYCNTPWKIIGLFTAAFLLITAGVQAVCSLLQLKQHL